MHGSPTISPMRGIASAMLEWRRRDGDSVGFREWIWCARVLRMAAARWRKRAEKLAPVLACLVWCCVSGCAKVSTPPPREFTVNSRCSPRRTVKASHVVAVQVTRAIPHIS